MSESTVSTFDGTATNTKAAIDLVIDAGNYTTASGADGVLSFTFAHTATASNVGATVNSNGQVTISIDATGTYTATDIQALLQNVTAASGVSSDIVDAVKGASVTGTGLVAATGTAAGIVNTTADSTAAGTGANLVLQIGDTSDDFNKLEVSIKDCHAAAIGIAGLDISTQDGAAAALDTIKSAINYVSDVRGTLGATQNRLDHTINNLSVMEENIQDAESTIRDTDVADEMMAYTKNNILIQSAQAMLAQANQVPQGVLQLLQ